MKNLLLPGRHASNLPWAQALASLLSQPFEVVEYPWWRGDEAVHPKHIAAGFAGDTYDCVVAKSIGSLVAALVSEQPWAKKVVLIGVPLNVLSDAERDFVKQFVARHRTLIIQQANDKTASMAQVKAWLADTSCEFVEVPGEDHMYEAVEDLAGVVDRWLGGSQAI
ncbi:hypothetical protein [Salinibius halmophilus]|uniref:hypothetical protein n=1 Tax=Salinibius halmophilus TaxID=1853216 RepID=UPI000E662656|nr:hypothetical protein [Salinibius halmophilus]